MNQTAFVFGAVLFAWVFFITVRGDLPRWLGLLGLAGGGTSGGTVSSIPALPSLPSLTAPAALTGGGLHLGGT